MGLPRTPFEYLSFTTLIPNLSSELIASHFGRLAETLQEFYQTVEISSDELLQRVSLMLSSDSGSRKIEYSFHAQTNDVLDQWKVILYLTQIPHFESGLSFGKHNARFFDPELPYRLVERKLAAVVVYKNSPQTQRSILSRLFLPNEGTSIVGEVAGFYLILKIGSIPSLQKKWKWEIYEEDSFRFLEFSEEVRSTLSLTRTDSLVNIPFDQRGPLQEFVAKCDSEIVTALTRSQLDKMLSLIGSSFDEWFGAKI